MLQSATAFQGGKYCLGVGGGGGGGEAGLHLKVT